MASPANIPAYILCGGRSRRFGTDKARAVIDGQLQIVKLAAELRRAGHDTFFVADRADRYADSGITCLVDEYAQSGPMAGLCTALKHRAQLVRQTSQLAAAGQGAAIDMHAPIHDWILLVSCDQAHWDDAWYTNLMNAAFANSAAEIAAYFAEGLWQPLPSLAHIALIDELELRLRSQRLSLKSLLSDLQPLAKSLKVETAVSPSAWSFNTPDELVKLRKP